MVDPHQLQQVVLNIINNARQAIEAHQPKGTIRIASEICGNLVRISFQDDGPGISTKKISRKFSIRSLRPKKSEKAPAWV